MTENENIEMITGDPKKAIVKLAIPMMLSMFLIILYNLTDSIWVSGLGDDALAAIGFISPLFGVLVGLGNGIGAGANSLIARNIGAENYDEANNAALHAILLCIVISLVSTVVMILFMRPILEMMGAGETINFALDYGNIIFGFLFVFVYAGVVSAIFRSEGDMKRATYAIAVTTVINMILDPIFIYVLGMGMVGAAWATVFSDVLACIVMSYWIWIKKDLYLDLSPKNFHFDVKIIIDEMQVAIPSTFENLVFSILAVTINGMLVLADGTTAVAVYTAAVRIVQLAMIPLLGIGTAVLTVAGVAYGARNAENLKICHSYSIKLGFILSIAIGIVMYVFSPQIASLFAYTSASAAMAPRISTAISILSLFVLAIPHGIMSAMIFQGVGKGVYSLIITLLRSLIFESVCAYLFGFVLGWGVMGIYAGLVLGCFIGGIFAYIWAKIFISKCEKQWEAS